MRKPTIDVNLAIPIPITIAVSYGAYAAGHCQGNLFVVASGLYIVGAMVARLVLRKHLSLRSATVWLMFDASLWGLGWYASNWCRPVWLVGVIFCAQAVLIGWPVRRGLYHTAAIAALLFGVPLFGMGWTLYVQMAYQSLLGLSFVLAFVHMASNLLEQREELARAWKAAELANTQLREYARQVEELAVTRERHRLAREVHDTIAHAFTSIIMQLEATRRLLDRAPASVPDAIAAAQEQARQGLNDTRRSVHALRPLALEERDLGSALRQLVADFQNTTGIATVLNMSGIPPELPVAHELCLYRSVQEALTNAFRHGHARSVRVRLQKQADTITLCVEDDGRGPLAPGTAGIGLIGVEERANALGGRMSAGPSPRGGFLLDLQLPLDDKFTGGEIHRH